MPKGFSKDGTPNLPAAKAAQMEPNAIADALGGYSAILTMSPCKKDNPREVQARLLKYWEFCEQGHRPTIELMSVFLGVSRNTLYEWSRDTGSETGRLVSQAKEMVNAFITDASMSGSIPFAYGIWQQKNHFNYREAVDINTNQLPQSSVPELSREDIIKRLKSENITPEHAPEMNPKFNLDSDLLEEDIEND